MRFHAMWFLSFPLLLAGSTSVLQARMLPKDSATGKQDLVRKALPAWEKYRARARRLQGSIELTTITLTPARQVLRTSRLEIKQRDGGGLLLNQGLGSGTRPQRLGRVEAVNRSYGFHLSRPNSGAPWTLSRLEEDVSAGKTSLYADVTNNRVAFWPTCPTTFALIPSFPLQGLDGPGFTVKQVSPVIRDGEHLVKAEVDYRRPTEKSLVYSLTGWVLYIPKRSWVIREYSFQFQLRGVPPGDDESTASAAVGVTYSYNDGDDEFPVPKRVVRWLNMKPLGGTDSELQADYNLTESESPESDFTLSAFGLPEPWGSQPTELRRRPWHIWAAGLGIVCLGMALLMRRWSRRATGSS